MLEVIKKMGFTEPTQIQAESIPLIMKGKDVIGESATGSGKTLAFGAGIVSAVEPGKGIQSLVMAPTRELAEQVKEVLVVMSKRKKLRVAPIYGGVSINPQITDLRRADVVVGTPGRLLDHIERQTIDLSKVQVLVLDEADRMLDMGFIDDVEKIMKRCPKKKQTLFFSATMASEIMNLTKRYMNDAARVSATKMVDPKKLTQQYYVVPKALKFSLFVHLLKNETSGLVMVFCNTRRNTDFVVKNAKANGINAIAIHGGLTQNKRTKTLDTFNGGKVDALVCTDVAARGLHIDNVSHVYNYDIPKDPKDYVHRIGRTARAGESGKVINLLCELDYENFGRIQEKYREFKIVKVERPQVERANMKTVQKKKIAPRQREPRRSVTPRGRAPKWSSKGGFGRR